ncbi:MAG TPA: hypothetical protein VET85_12815 [Stellaceae bacterium]|nr:hypothetical protein [Stellaceae bacterium]
MHPWILTASAFAAALLVAGVVVQFGRTPPPETVVRPQAVPETAAPPSGGDGAVPRVDATLPPVPPAPLKPAPDLPTVEVAPRVVHVVPDVDPAPPRPVTFQGRDGRQMTQRMPSPSPPPVLKPPLPPNPATQISGAARVADVVSLDVLGRPVRLFGVKPPQPGDHCAMAGQNATRSCIDAARDALAARLRNNATVYCRVPEGQRASNPAAICMDSAGVDLAGFLVGEGLALADPAQSYDYTGAEGVARTYRRGLWRYR